MRSINEPGFHLCQGTDTFHWQKICEQLVIFSCWLFTFYYVSSLDRTPRLRHSHHQQYKNFPTNSQIKHFDKKKICTTESSNSKRNFNSGLLTSEYIVTIQENKLLFSVKLIHYLAKTKLCSVILRFISRICRKKFRR